MNFIPDAKHICSYTFPINKLTAKPRTQILHMLSEGTTLRSISRMTGVSINTVGKLLLDAGNACAVYHDDAVRGLKSKRVKCDEIWSFNYAKQKNVETAKQAPEGAGDTCRGRPWIPIAS